MAYRCLATSVAGFVQQLAVAYITHGYWFYVTGRIPEHKDPAMTDRKLIERYDIDVSKWTRARRKRAGLASVQYLRHGRFFVLLATHGEHPLFVAEGNQVQDIRRRPLKFMGYSIGCRQARNGGRYHASVRIERQIYSELKARFEGMAAHRDANSIEAEFFALHFEPYAPVRGQIFSILRAVNRARKAAGFEPVGPVPFRVRRAPARPFE